MAGPLTVPALLRARAAARGEHPLLICDDEVLTYAEAERRSAELARRLLALGAGKGTHVALLYPNGADFVVAWLATARIGAVSIPLSTFSTAAELQTLLHQADVEILLGVPAFRSHDYAAKLRQVEPGPTLRHVSLAPLDGPMADGELLVALEARVGPADRMVIVHTSGSTSTPKGVIHQHGPLLWHIANLNAIRRLDENEVFFSNSPFFWIGGFAFVLVSTLLAGATTVCSNATEASAVLDLLERTRPTLANGFAASVAHLAKDPSFPGRDLSSLRRGNLWPIMPDGVRPSDPELRHNMLGMTETGSVCLLSDDESDQPEHRRGSFGRPAPGFEACISSDGELLLRGPFLMEGYYGRESPFDLDGWFHTGDLFEVDAEGFYYFRGRLGEMIKTAGANVSPREVEAAILIECGLTAHVVGLDDAERGQIVAAVVRSPAVDPDDLRTRVRARLSAYKVPQVILALRDDEVPTMSSGKLDLKALKARLTAEGVR